MVTDLRLTELVKQLRPRSRAGGVGRGARRDRADRRDRRDAEHRLRLRLGARLSARADRRSPAADAARRSRRRRRWRASSASTPSSSTRCRSSAARRPRSRSGAVSSAQVPRRRWRRRSHDRGGMIFEHTAADEFSDAPLSVKGERPHDHLPGHRARDAQAAGGQRRAWSARRCFRPSSRSTPATSIGGRVSQGAHSRRAVLGHRRSVPLPAARAAPRPRHRDLRRRGSQDRAGADTNACFDRLERTLLSMLGGRRGDAPLVGPGDRDAGRPAVHRRDRRASVRRHRLLRQRHDVRHARRDDGGRRILGRTNPWSELFDPGRKKIRGALWDYVKENKDYPYYLIRDRFAGAEGRSLRDGAARTGKVIESERAERRRLPRRARRDDRSARPSARTWAASSTGTTPSGRGTARATARGSSPTGQ